MFSVGLGWTRSGASTVPVGEGLVPGRGGRAVAVADSLGLAEAVALPLALAVGVTRGGGPAGVGRGVTIVVEAGVAFAAGGPTWTGAGRGGGTIRRSGLTNFFGGRFGGGVASALILARAFCAASLSLIPDQPRYTTG